MHKLTRICEFNGLVKFGISLVSTKNPSYCSVFVLSRVLDATDLKPEVDVMIRLGVWHIPYSFWDVQGRGGTIGPWSPPQESKFYFRHWPQLQKSQRMTIDSPQNRVWPLQRFLNTPWSTVFYLPQLSTPSTKHPLALCHMPSTGCWVSADESQFWKILGPPPGVRTQDIQRSRPGVLLPDYSGY